MDVQGFFLKSACSSILFFVELQGLLLCSQKSVITGTDLATQQHLHTCKMCKYINIFIYLIQSVQLSVEPGYEVWKPPYVIHMNNLNCVMQLVVCQSKCWG